MSILDRLKQVKLDNLKTVTGNAVNWFSKQIKAIEKKTPHYVSAPVIGKLYIAQYDPKHKRTLPYYDTIPLFMPITYSKEGNVVGINFHYLHPKIRKILMTKLMEFAENDKLDQKTKLNLSYKMLNAASKYKEIQPTIHSYIKGHFRSKIVEIPGNMWEIAMVLPTANFVGASKKTVYKNSRKAY